MARGAQAGTVSLAAVLGLGCLGRTGWGRAWCWHFPTPSAPWGRLVQRAHRGVPVLLGSSTGSAPYKGCPLLPGAVGSGGCAFPPLTPPFTELAQGRALNEVFGLWALQKSPKNRTCLVGCV